jgi:hypothetical protein
MSSSKVDSGSPGPINKFLPLALNLAAFLSAYFSKKIYSSSPRPAPQASASQMSSSPASEKLTSQMINKLFLFLRSPPPPILLHKVLLLLLYLPFAVLLHNSLLLLLLFFTSSCSTNSLYFLALQILPSPASPTLLLF